MKKVLITGGTGTWGQEIVRQLLNRKDVKQIIVYSRAERSQEAMKRSFKDARIEYVLGDVCDYDRINGAMNGVDTVFHTAAIKAVPNMEKDCMYGYNINIQGTYNTVRASVVNNVKRFVFVSTDKAVAPINAYGVSKAAAEHIVRQASRDNPKMKFRIVRSGNVIGSSSSVLHMWKEGLVRDNKVRVTIPQMSRFYIRIEDAVEGLFKALNGESLIVANLSKNATLTTLLQVAIKLWGNAYSKVEYIGNRGNEKLHEQILSSFDGDNYTDTFSNDTQEYTLNELIEIVKNEGI